MSAGVSEPPPMVERTVSILVASTFPIEPTVVMVVVATFQTAAGSALMDEPSEVEAVSTALLVFAFMTVAKDEVATATLLSVFAFTTAARDEDAIPTRVSVFALIAVWLFVMAEPRDDVAVCTSLSVARLPVVSPAPVRVRVAALHTSLASVPKPVRVRTEAFQTLIGMEVASEEDAASTVAFVFVLTAVWLFVTAEPSDVEAVVTRASVFAFTIAATDEEAVCTSDNVASEPDESEAPVSVRVPFVHTSAASVPKPVRVRVPAAHTFAGIEAIEEAIVERVEPSEEDAVSTVAFVFALITAASDDEAVCIVLFVLPFMTVARDEEAVSTLLSVFAFIAVWLLVIAEPSEEDAVSTVVFVFPFTTAAIELEAMPTRVSVLLFIAV
jgi:hypothetical protein